MRAAERACCEPIEMDCCKLPGESQHLSLGLLGARGLPKRKSTQSISEAVGLLLPDASKWLWMKRCSKLLKGVWVGGHRWHVILPPLAFPPQDISYAHCLLIEDFFG